MLLLFVYCALLTLSLFNTIVLVWLGAIVLLNTERRRWSIWLAGCGLLAGAAVFVSQSAVLMRSASAISPELNAWWPVGWIALVFAPFAWYIAMLWHAGYWDDARSALHRRQRGALLLTLALAVCLLILLAVARPLPFSIKISGLDLSATPALFGLPLVVLLYPLFIVLCIGLSLDAVLRPGQPPRATVGPARRRARPWLVAASLALLVVSLLVVGILLWLVSHLSRMHALSWLAVDLGAFDLIVTALISVAVVLTGQAVVAYEVFAGRTLPSRELRRQWHHAIILGAGYGLAVAASFTLLLPGAYIVLLATVLVAVTYALFSWRSYLERERYITHLRPFIASEHVYDAVLASQAGSASGGESGGPTFPGPGLPRPAQGIYAPFAALCNNVLGAGLAYLIPTARMASLVGGPLVHPPGSRMPPDVTELIQAFGAPDAASLAVDPTRYAGAIWALPLWGARGLSGLLLLGEKNDLGLYSQEEIEIARSYGERLLDTIAGANLAQRLMALQRQRFVENQVLDQQSRRALHDEILPGVHAAMLSLSRGGPPGRPGAADPNLSQALEQLAEVHRRTSALLRDMPTGLASQVGRLGLIGGLRQMVETEFLRAFDNITWDIAADAEQKAQAIPPLTADVIFYAAKESVRNAARHGRGGDPARPLNLRIRATWPGGLEIRITDDGIGLAAMQEFAPTSGQGLALHGTTMAVIGGSLVAESQPDGGTAVTLFLPQEAM